MDRGPWISSRIDRGHLRSNHRQTTRIRIRQPHRRHRSPESDRYNERTTNGWASIDRQQSDSFDRKTRTIFTGRKASSSCKIPLIHLKRTAPEVISSGAGPTLVCGPPDNSANESRTIRDVPDRVADLHFCPSCGLFPANPIHSEPRSMDSA